MSLKTVLEHEVAPQVRILNSNKIWLCGGIGRRSCFKINREIVIVRVYSGVLNCENGGIGRRASIRSLLVYSSVGSSPTSRTICGIGEIGQTH